MSHSRFFNNSSTDRKDTAPTGELPLRRQIANTELDLVVKLPEKPDKEQLADLCNTLKSFEASVLDFKYSQFNPETLKPILEAATANPFVTEWNFTGCNFMYGHEYLHDCFHLVGSCLTQPQNGKIQILRLEGIRTWNIGSLERKLSSVKEIYFGLSEEELKQEPKLIFECEDRVHRQLRGISQAMHGAPAHLFSLRNGVLSPLTAEIFAKNLLEMPNLSDLRLPSLAMAPREFKRNAETSPAMVQTITDQLCQLLQKPTLKKVNLSNIWMQDFLPFNALYEKLCKTILDNKAIEQAVMSAQAFGVQRTAMMQLCNASNREILTQLNVDPAARPELKARMDESNKALFLALTDTLQQGTFISSDLIKLIFQYIEFTPSLALLSRRDLGDFDPRVFFDTLPQDFDRDRRLYLNDPDLFIIRFPKKRTENEVKKDFASVNEAKGDISQMFHAFRFFTASALNYLTHYRFQPDDKAGRVLLDLIRRLNEKLLDMIEHIRPFLSEPSKIADYISHEFENTVLPELDAGSKQIHQLKGHVNHKTVLSLLTQAKEIIASFIQKPAEKSSLRLP